jgi:excisionase family DNA binding protein
MLKFENVVLSLKSAIEPFLREIVRDEVEKTLEKLPKHDQPAKELLTIEELAKILKVKKSWIYDRTRIPDSIPTIRIGRLIRFNLDEVLLWLEKRNKVYR